MVCVASLCFEIYQNECSLSDIRQDPEDDPCHPSYRPRRHPYRIIEEGYLHSQATLVFKNILSETLYETFIIAHDKHPKMFDEGHEKHQQRFDATTVRRPSQLIPREMLFAPRRNFTKICRSFADRKGMYPGQFITNTFVVKQYQQFTNVPRAFDILCAAGYLRETEKSLFLTVPDSINQLIVNYYQRARDSRCQIDFAEMMDLLWLCILYIHAELLKALRDIDTDGDGLISKAELKAAVMACSKNVDEQKLDHFLKVMFEQLLVDEDGKVDYNTHWILGWLELFWWQKFEQKIEEEMMAETEPIAVRQSKRDAMCPSASHLLAYIASRVQRAPYRDVGQSKIRAYLDDLDGSE